jgi:hypothetical protein
MIWSFVIVCWGLNCPPDMGVVTTPVNYEDAISCEDAAVRRTVLLGELYPMHLMEPPMEMPKPDHIFRYMCARA